MFEELKFHKTGVYLLKMLQKLDHRAIAVSASSALLESFSFYAGLIFSAKIIDDLLAQAWDLAAVHSVVLILLSLFCGLLQNHLSKAMAVKYQMLYTDLKICMRKKALSMSFEQFENPEVTKKIYLAERTIDMYGGLEEVLYLYQQLFTCAVSVVTAVGMVISMCFAKGEMSRGSVVIAAGSFLTAVCLVMKATITSSRRLLKQQNEIYSEHGDAEEGLSYYMDRIYGNPEANKVSHLYQMKEMLLDNFNGFLKESSGLYKRMRTVRRKQELTGQAISMLFTLYSYTLILIKIGGKAISVGSFSQYAGAMTRFMNDMTTIVWTNGEIARKCEFLQGLIDFMEMEEERKGGMLPIPSGTEQPCEIEFHDVSFHYPGSEIPVLKHIHCKIDANKKTAVVGKNGAGKSTFIKLLCGLYQPTEGTITLNGTDLREYDPGAYLNLFGVVFQDFELFAFSVGENIAASNSWEEDRVWDCLRKAGAAQAVEQMPKKLQTVLAADSEEGSGVSGGEKQKLAIARALYKDAAIMILDEPTAALDPLSEYEIYRQFDEMVKDKTSIFITHRMSSCRFCDDIIVFDSGEIVERGSHEALLKERKLYAQLWNAQAKHYQK